MTFGNFILGVELHKGILNSSCLLILLFTPNTNTLRRNLGPTSRSHFPKGELIHWVGKVKNVLPIVGRPPMGAEW